MSELAPSGYERRVHRRRVLDAPMWIVVGNARVPVTAVNVSVGGAAVHSSAKADVGAFIRLEVELRADSAFVLEAEVVRAEDGILGLRFLALGQRALESLLEASGDSARSEAERDDPSGVRHGSLTEDPSPEPRRGTSG